MKRNDWSVPVLAIVGLSLLGGAALGGSSVRGDDPVVVDVDTPDGTVHITWGGDTMLGDGAEARLKEYGYDWVFEDITALLSGDVVVVNAEGPITTIDEPFMPQKPYSYASDPATAEALANAGVDVLGLANNHAMDQGPRGLIQTMEYADAAGMVSFGAGVDDAQAERPLLLKGSTLTVGIVALAKGYGTSVTAGSGRAGTVPFSDASITRGYKLAKAAGADHVVAYVHWGRNYSPIPTSEQAREARRFEAAGYDLVIGHGPHVVQGLEMIDSMPVVHSLGNLVFGAPGRFDSMEADGYGLLADTVFGTDGLKEIRLTCILTDNQEIDYQPTACGEQEAQEVLSGLGVPVSIDGHSATVDLDAATR